MAFTKEDVFYSQQNPYALVNKLNDLQAGGTTPAAFQANSTATDVAGLVTDFNALLAKLKTAGIMSNS